MAIASLTIGPGTIKSLRKNVSAREQFPFLQNPPQKTVYSCSSCGGQQKTTEIDWNWCYRRIVNLDAPLKLKFKQLLRAARIVVNYYDDHRARHTKIF